MSTACCTRQAATPRNSRTRRCSLLCWSCGDPRARQTRQQPPCRRLPLVGARPPSRTQCPRVTGRCKVKPHCVASVRVCARSSAVCAVARCGNGCLDTGRLGMWMERAATVFKWSPEEARLCAIPRLSVSVSSSVPVSLTALAWTPACAVRVAPCVRACALVVTAACWSLSQLLRAVSAISWTQWSM